MRRAKITVIGAGHVGATVAHVSAMKELGDVVLVDVVDGLPQGKGLDIMEGRPIFNYDVSVVGSNGYEETAGSDVVVITCGVARKPGMSREDLLKINKQIISTVVEESAVQSPGAILLMVTNPLDTMTCLAKSVSGFPTNRVLGQAGVLDTARFRTFVAMELDVSVEDVHALVLGGHGDSMVPLVRHCSVAGIPLTELISADRIDSIVDRTRKGGGEIVSLLKTGSAYYAPGMAAAEMVEAIVRDKKRILPCSAWLEGQYGLKDLYFGVPAKIGAGGMEGVIEISLNDEEKAMVASSGEAVKKSIEELGIH